MDTESGTETETEQPLSSQEDYNFMKTMQPNLSDEINGILKQEQPDCDSSQAFFSGGSSEHNTYWKSGGHHQNFKQSGKTLPPCSANHPRVQLQQNGKTLSPSSTTTHPSMFPRESHVAPCAEIVSVVTPSNTYYTSSSTSMFADRLQQTADFTAGNTRGEATSSRSPASPNVEPAYKRPREISWSSYRDEVNIVYKKVAGGYGGYNAAGNDDESQISSSTVHVSYIEDINTIPADQLSVTGKYLFRMEYEADTTRPAKSCNYTFSKPLQKAFVQVDKVVPFKFVSEIPLPAQYVQIRSYLVYKDIHSREIVVDRCPHHLSRQEFSNPHHVMDTIDGPIGEHIICPCTHRYITILRPGITHSNHKINSFCGNLRFRCASSCRGGIDRRPILALFELYVNNRFSGRSSIEVSICSSPGRDRINQEEKLMRSLYPEMFVTRPEDDNQQEPMTGEMKDTCFPAKGILKEGKSFDDDTFLIKVKGSKNAELVGKLAKQLNDLEDIKNKNK